jgi:hypothetical protein
MKMGRGFRLFGGIEIAWGLPATAAAASVS